ncbi:MAG: hypothetical protein LOD94_04010 [Gammaproteobacteria bacterium]
MRRLFLAARALVPILWLGAAPFGAAPAAYVPPPPIPAASAALGALAARIAATLDATTPAGVGTLLEFADVLESVREEAADKGDRPPAGCSSARAAQ